MYLKVKQVIKPGSLYSWSTYGPFEKITHSSEPHTEGLTRNIDEGLIYDHDIEPTGERPEPVYHVHMTSGGRTYTIGVNVQDAYLLNEAGRTMEHLCFAAGRRVGDPPANV